MSCRNCACQVCNFAANKPVDARTPVCPDFPAPTTDRIGKWVQPAYALPAMSRLVPLWAIDGNWKTLELGSRAPIDGDGGWLWAPADGDSEKFADLSVVAWFDLPVCGDVATPDPRDAEIAALKATLKQSTLDLMKAAALIERVRWHCAHVTPSVTDATQFGNFKTARDVLAILDGGNHG